MKNKNEELANNTGEFVDWLVDTIHDRMYLLSKIGDRKSMGTLNQLLDDILEKLLVGEEA